jgi:hypothetical protein
MGPDSKNPIAERFARMARANEAARLAAIREMTVERGIRALEDILHADHLGLPLPPAPLPQEPISLSKLAKRS